MNRTQYNEGLRRSTGRPSQPPGKSCIKCWHSQNNCRIISIFRKAERNTCPDYKPFK